MSWCYASGSMLNSCMCVRYLDLFLFETLSTVVKYLIHTFCVYVFILCVLVVLFGAGYLIGSWFLTAQSYMLDWLGDVTSTVSFCQLSGGVFTQQIHLCIICMFCVGLYHTYDSVKLLHFVSCFVHVLFYLYLMYKFHTLWNQYTDST